MQVQDAGDKRSVLIVSNLFPPHVVGGAEIVAFRQAQGLRMRGHTVSVFAGWISPDERKGRLEVETIDGLRVWRTPVISFDPDDNFHIPSITARLRSVIAAEQPDIVHLHNLNGLGWSVVPMIRRLGVPVVATLHDHGAYCYRATALRPDGSICGNSEECGQVCRGAIRPAGISINLPIRLRRDYVAWTLGQVSRLISPSRYLAAAIRASGTLDPVRLDVISNGIDLTPFRALSPVPHAGVPLRFLCAAYLGEHKGIPDLLAAVRILAANPVFAGRWMLTIAGDGHLRALVEDAAKDDSISEHICFAGRLSHERMIAEIAGSNVVVLPSRWPENEPVVILEAIAAGVATLATAVGGIPDLIEAGYTGDMVPPAQPEALAAAMAAYINDPQRAHRQGRANRDRRERFAEDATLDAVEATHASICAAPAMPDRSRPVVLCAGDQPPQIVAEVCSNLHRLEQPGKGARLVWHEWAEASDWESAALFWNWSSGASRVPMQRALRAGVPVLAPRSCALAAGIELCYGAAITYSGYLEVLAALARLPHDIEALALLRNGCRAASDFLHSTAPTELYHLPVPVHVI